VHRKKRKYLNPAFSSRALAEFEPYMDDEIRKWKRQLLSMTEVCNTAMVDFSVWGQLLATHSRPLYWLTGI
jgi:benzoate 4-monooxygenase